ncbi:helix-turn-helix domain-containing protein [Brevibacterium spongiae]|uniref:Helix-turn-helix domain-containing protein n=1 Tax=Brevibacterium spongiae TaxID=2909672 RepID=A0ABY5SUH1_9MICO|nr:helix-turn-helix domain-containing protein [Brevibacterium spongiae]UVI36696.1 helix-turn-helix domain-containing protein [Brevibacterium spongiae]
MTTTDFSREELFLTRGLPMSTMSISGTSIPVMIVFEDDPLRPASDAHQSPPNSSADKSPNVDSAAPVHAEIESTADLVKQIKTRGAYTWDQVAKLFGVSRRTVHLWASGGRISAANEEALGRVMRQIETIEEAGGLGARLRFLALLDQQRWHHASTPTDVNRPAPTYSPEP